jgi:hypothetical protein
MNQMMKQEVLAAWKERAIRAESQISDVLEPKLKRLHYEEEITKRLLAKATDESAQQTWQTQVDVLDMLITMAENDLAEQQEELALCEAMIGEIEADLAEDQIE